MSRTCTICSHAQRGAIDAALVAGEPFRAIAGRFSVSRSALQRHRNGQHVPAILAETQQAADVAQAGTLLEQVRELQAKAMDLLGKAENDGDTKVALSGIGQARQCLELQAKLLGELDERPTVNVLVLPEWVAIRATLLDALRAFPEARQAVAAALLRLEAGNVGA